MDLPNPASAPPRATPAFGPEGGWVTAQPPKAAEIARRIVGFPRLCVAYRDLIRTSVRRELQARFTGTALGWLWPLLTPLLLFAVYYFIFTKLLGLKFGDELPPGQESAMGIFMFVGIVIWSAFAESIMRGCGVIVENGNLIKKLAFPSEVLPLNVVLVSKVTMLFAVAMFVAATVATPVWLAPGPMLAWIPLLVLIQGVFTLGLVLFISALQVFLRDTIQVMSVVTTVWMFITPIFWAPELIPGIEPYLWVVEANPMFHLIYAWRVVLMSAEPAFVFNHDFGTAVAVFSAWAVGFFVVGYAFFVLCQRRFADEV